MNAASDFIKQNRNKFLRMASVSRILSTANTPPPRLFQILAETIPYGAQRTPPFSSHCPVSLFFAMENGRRNIRLRYADGGTRPNTRKKTDPAFIFVTLAFFLEFDRL